MEKKGYSIIASAEAFDTLSSKLYSNPIAAIIRELSCNAYDSHVMANKKDVPFDLHIPTENEPFFRIRDYGLGMSDGFVMDVYTTYFASTKSTNEKQIGAFGLGSKTPYALVKEYKVTSFYDNKKSVYKMSKSNGLPAVEKISEEPSTEPRGLEIYFDVDASNSINNFNDYIYDDFKREAEYFFRTTLFQPNWNLFLSDQDLLNFAESKKYFNKDSAYLKCDINNIPDGLENSYRGSRDISVNVAGVIFYVKKYDIGELNHNLNSFYTPINIMADKDDVTVTPNRETLHFDDKTINFIKSKLNTVMDNGIKTLKEKIDRLDINLEELKSITNYCYSSIPKEIVESATKLINENFGKVSFLESYYRGVSHISRCNISDEGNKNIFFGILDYSGCKSQQETTVLKMLKEEGRKVSSKAFKDRVSSFFNSSAPKESRCNIIITIKPGREAIAEKLLEGTSHSTFMYKDYATTTAKSGPAKKRGFITQSTTVFDNYKDVTTYDRRTVNPYLKDDEIGLIHSGDIDSFMDFFPFLKIAKPNIKLVVRCVADDSVAKNVSSSTKAPLAKDWLFDVLSENIGLLNEFVKATSLKTFLNNTIGYFNYRDDDLFAKDKLDIYSTFAKSETSKKLLESISYVRDNIDKVWDRSLFLGTFKIPNIKVESDFAPFDKELFPMLNFLSGRCNSEFLCLVIEYISLIEQSPDFEKKVQDLENKKKQVA